MCRSLRDLETKIAFVSPVPMVAALSMRAIRNAEERERASYPRTRTGKPKAKRKPKAAPGLNPQIGRAQRLDGARQARRVKRAVPIAVPGSVFDVRMPKAGRGRGRRG